MKTGFTWFTPITNSSDSDYETKYQRNPSNQSSWTADKVVTDESGVNGGFPGVTTSSSRVHVTFTAGDWDDPVGNRDVAKTRDLSSSTWQSSYELFDDTGLSWVIATSGYLHGFYYDFVPFRYDLYHKTRSLTGTTWSGSSSLILVNSDPSEPIGMAVTNDGNCT
ncbi:MAG: hypothetical protein H6629_21545 [Calditrichae bacterium]|nr:hypothetical protein [Calditrichia bacterium]